MSCCQDESTQPIDLPALPAGRRLYCLDGLRGVAALTVVFHHFFSGFAPALVAHAGPTPSAFALSPAAAFVNGLFPVYIFFVLSGFVLAGSSAAARESLPLRAAKRVLRLGVPAVASCLVAWALVQAFPTASERLSHLVDSDWLKSTRYLSPYPSFADAIHEGTIAAFWSNDFHLNGVLWTMRVELFGSLLIYIVFARLHWALKAGLAALILSTSVLQASTLLAFASGALLKILWDRGLLRESRWSIPLILVGVYLGAMVQNPLTGIFYWPFRPLIDLARSGGFVAATAGAVMLVAGVLMNVRLQGLLDREPVQWLGRVSFGLYLVHMPLELTFFAAVFLAAGVSPTAVALAVALSAFVALSLVAGWLMTVCVTGPTLQLLRRLRPPSESTGRPSETKSAAVA